MLLSCTVHIVVSYCCVLTTLYHIKEFPLNASVKYTTTGDENGTAIGHIEEF